ncbi:hypothetical protein NKG95_24355 [Mesorhizobium sp. M1423]|uniref:hypothetical protein n=1 Tax=Mesorhizobium sp. M1423 TaxID=2957101 RepID=UPI003336BC96
MGSTALVLFVRDCQRRGIARSALTARKSRRVKSARDAPVPIRFVIVVSGWAPLGTSAVDCVKNKKAAGQVFASGVPGAGVDLSGSFACGARHWTPCHLALADLHVEKQEACQFDSALNYRMKPM